VTLAADVPLQLGFALVLAAVFISCREVRAVQERAEAALSLPWNRISTLMAQVLSYAADLGIRESSAGIEQIQQGLRAFRAWRRDKSVLFLALLAEAHGT